MAHDHNENDEKMILAHDAVEGYRPAFLVAFAVGVIYLGFILLRTL